MWDIDQLDYIEFYLDRTTSSLVVGGCDRDNGHIFHRNEYK